MKHLTLILVAISFCFFSKSQFLATSATATFTSYNLKTIAYTPTMPPPDIIPIDEDTSHEIV